MTAIHIISLPTAIDVYEIKFIYQYRKNAEETQKLSTAENDEWVDNYQRSLRKSQCCLTLSRGRREKEGGGLNKRGRITVASPPHV